MDWLFISSSPLSGVGQVMCKYKQLFESHGHTVNLIPYYEFDKHEKDLKKYENAMYYIIPTPESVALIPRIKKKCKHLKIMTICETETVHEYYGLLFDYTTLIYVPSLFCLRILSRQFPLGRFKLLPHWTPPPQKNISHKNVPKNIVDVLAQGTYKFYHIGNAVDPRKQLDQILNAFIKLNKPYCQLVIKATCHAPIEINVPNVIVINGLVSDEIINYIHHKCHCYVNFSCSEGVGMGNIDAALHGNPIIFPEYGGCREYIKTPYMITCGRKKIKDNDFLFQKGMEWGDPYFNELMVYMNRCYEMKLKHMGHDYTIDMMNGIYSKYIASIF